MIILDFIYFFFLLIFTFYIPGYLLLKLFNISVKDNLTNIFLRSSVGIALFMVSSYLLSWISLEFYYNIFLILCIPIFIKSVGKFPNFDFKKILKIESLIIITGTILTSYLMWRSGSVEDNSLVFYAVNSVDAIYHLSLIGNLKSNFPPTHPGLFGLPLNGYNFFYDLVIAYFSKFYRLEALDLFFRFFPITLSAFYGISGLVLGRFMGMKRETQLIFVTLLYFAQSFSRFVFPEKISMDPGIVQTIANIVDPSVILSISLLFAFYILVFSVNTKYSFVLAAIVLSVLPMIKIYTGFLAFLSIGIIFLIKLIRKKDLHYLPVILVGGIIFALTYLPINFGSGKLIFAPNLLYRHYLESISANYGLDWYQRLLVFEAHDNYIKTIFYKFILILPLFYLPSLGLRLINFVYLRKLLDKNLYTEKNLFWGFLILLSFLIPSFFIQSTAVFVVLQFLWIGYFILLIPTAYSLINFLGKINNLKLAVILLGIVLLSLPDNLRLLSLYSNNPYKIDLDLVEVSRELSKISKDQSVLLLNVEKNGDVYSAPYFAPIVSGLSEHSVYFEPELMEFGGIDKEIMGRKKVVGDINDLLLRCQDGGDLEADLGNRLREIDTSYILDLKKTPCFDKLENIELIFQKSNYSLYKTL